MEPITAKNNIDKRNLDKFDSPIRLLNFKSIIIGKFKF